MISPQKVVLIKKMSVHFIGVTMEWMRGADKC